MTQYDLLLTQNTHPSGTEFTEKLVNIAKGDLLSSDVNHVPTPLAGATHNGHMLVRDDLEVTGLKWVPISAGHTQNTDVGTSSNVFELGSGANKIELTAISTTKGGIKVDGGGSFADFEAKDATFNKVTVATVPSAGSDLTNKTYVDGLLAANDAMIYKGPATVAVLNALTTYNAGWTYRLTDAGTVWGNVAGIGDLVVAIVDRAGSGNANADWTVTAVNNEGTVIGPASVADNAAVVFDGTTGKLIKAHTSGALGSAAFSASTAFATAAQGTTADGAVPKSLFDAYTILAADVDNTPAALTVGASTIVGRKGTGGIVALTKTDILTLVNVTDGATANAKAIAAEVNTGTDDVKFLTPLALAGSNNIMGPGTASVDNVPVVWNGTGGKLLKSHASGALGTAAFTLATAYATAAQGTTADGAIPKSAGSAANMIIYSTAASTIAGLQMTASTILGMKAAGNVGALTPAEVMGILWVAAPATKTSAGVAGQLAKDTNYLYTCDATNTWSRVAKAVNWV